jgi:hypothetical protein
MSFQSSLTIYNNNLPTFDVRISMPAYLLAFRAVSAKSISVCKPTKVPDYDRCHIHTLFFLLKTQQSLVNKILLT